MPFIVVGGFLGAGKTTLVNRLLADTGGRRIAVLVNDFGAVNVDAALIASASGDAVALTNGCVCCSIGDDLAAALIRVLDAQPAFDAVVVEASGVSDPWRIAQIGLADPALALGGVIVLVDASVVREQAGDPLLADSLRRQLDGADLVVVNKTDLVDDNEQRRVGDWLEEVQPGVPRHETSGAELPEALLWGPKLGPRASRAIEPGHGHVHGDEHGHCHDEPDHAATFDTWSMRPASPLSTTKLRAALQSVPRGVLRLKGLVRTDELGWSEVQFAGRHGSLRRALAAPADAEAVLVAIGLRGRLPKAALDAWLAKAGG